MKLGSFSLLVLLLASWLGRDSHGFRINNYLYGLRGQPHPRELITGRYKIYYDNQDLLLSFNLIL